MHFSIGFLSYDFYEKRYAINYMYPGRQRQPALKHPSEKNICTPAYQAEYLS